MYALKTPNLFLYPVDADLLFCTSFRLLNSHFIGFSAKWSIGNLETRELIEGHFLPCGHRTPDGPPPDAHYWPPRRSRNRFENERIFQSSFTVK